MECTASVVITAVTVMVICASVPSVKGLSNYEESEEDRDGGISENILEVFNYLLRNTSSETNINSYGDITGWLNPTIQSPPIENFDSHGENKIKETEVTFPASVAAHSGKQELRRNETFRHAERSTKDEEG
jgi:hypothetical protein